MSLQHLRQPSGAGPLGGLLLIQAFNTPEPSKILAKAIGVRGARIESLVERNLDRAAFNALKLSGCLPGPELQEWITDLKERIVACQSRAVVTLGEDVFQLLTGRYDHKLSDVHAYAYQLMLPTGESVALYPTYSPSEVFAQPDRRHWLHFAVNKAARFQARDPNVACQIAPTLAEVQAFLARCATSVTPLSIDIECIRETCELTAIAIATGSEVMSIPFAKQFMEDYWTIQEEAPVWSALAQLLAGTQAKIFQNAMFDVMILEHFGLKVGGPIEDTLWIANLLNPELPKGLKDLGRQYLFCEPWKTQKDFTLSGDPYSFWRYNALDASRTLAIYRAQGAEIDARGLRPFYDSYIRPLLNPALDTCRSGMNIDHKLYASFKETIDELANPLKNELRTQAAPLIAAIAKRIRKRNKAKDVRGPSPKTGKDIVLVKGYDESIEPFNPASPPQVKLALKALGYRIPIKKGSETTDHTALLKLNRKAPSPFIEALIRFKKLEKLRSSYLNIPFDQDGRLRFCFNRARDNDNNLGTKSGRFGCSTTPWGTGLNIQTIPRPAAGIPINLRDIFIPEASENGTPQTLIEVDLSQAELRVVAWLSGDPRLNAQLEAGDDLHQFMADEIKRTLQIDVNRQFGKFVNHSTAYGMGKYKFCDEALNKLDLSIDPEFAQRVIDLRMQAYPLLKTWQSAIADQVRTTRRLISPHGRERFFFGEYNDQMHREALSFIPQATVVDCLNGAWIALAKNADYGINYTVKAQIHDSLLFSVKPDFANSFLAIIDAAFAAQTVVIKGQPRLIPWDKKMGSAGASWGKLKAI